MNYLVKAQVNYFNEYVKDPGSPPVRFEFQNSIYFECKVVDIISEPYGKYPTGD